MVSRAQLLAIGVTPMMLRTRLASGVLRPLHRGVYAVGHRSLRREGFWLAAVLAAGPGAALSHRDAAALHGMRHPHDGRTDVTTPSRPRPNRHLNLHARRVLHPLDATIRHGIPVTTVARTLVDLADVLQPHQLEKALSEAERLRVADVGEIDAALARTYGRAGRGHRRIKDAVQALREHGAQLTRSELEDRLGALLDAHGLPRARMNATLHGYEVDAYWPHRRLIVELDGWQHHQTRGAFERDRAKTNRLQLLGYTVLRFTHRQVTGDAAATAAAIAAALGR